MEKNKLVGGQALESAPRSGSRSDGDQDCTSQIDYLRPGGAGVRITDNSDPNGIFLFLCLMLVAFFRYDPS